MTSLINQTLLSQFRVDAFVASGGMGSVYRVWDLKRNVPLAMKVLHAELAEDPSIFKRFKREANALKKLAHPNIVPFYGLYQTLDLAFLLERYIDGPSLKEILRQKKNEPLPTSNALAYLKALCAALGYAHANGVVHCDVKPANVMVDRGGNIYLTDFGIARHAESTTTTLGAAGTPAYMAPEQILGKEVTPAADVYALGVMLFEMLTGQRPFRGTEEGTEKSGQTANERIRFGHLHLEPPNPHSINEMVSESVAQTILKALNKDAAERYRSAPDFFAAVCAAAGITANEVANQVVISQATDKQDYSTGEEIIAPPSSEKGTRNLVPWLLGGGGMTIILFAILMFSRSNPLLPASTQTPLPTYTSFPTPIPTDTPLPTQTLLPTYTPYPTPQPQYIYPPTSTPQSGPMLHLNYNSMCRVGPLGSYTDVTSFPAGQDFPIVGQYYLWYLVQVEVPGSKYKRCWIYINMNTVKGNTSSIPQIDDPSTVRLYP